MPSRPAERSPTRRTVRLMNRLAWFVPLLAAGVLSGQTAPVDLILIHGHVITVDRRFSIAQAVAVSRGRFTAVGSTEDIRKLAGPGTRTIDVNGQTVIPGLADGH